MLKVTLLAGVICLKILLFNGCGEDHKAPLEEIRYENKLDSQYERKIDSAYGQVERHCDSTLDTRWKLLEDSVLQSRHALDSAAKYRDSLSMASRDSLAKALRHTASADHRNKRASLPADHHARAIHH